LPIDYFCIVAGQPDNWQVSWEPDPFFLERYDQKQKLAEGLLLMRAQPTCMHHATRWMTLILLSGRMVV